MGGDMLMNGSDGPHLQLLLPVRFLLLQHSRVGHHAVHNHTNDHIHDAKGDELHEQHEENEQGRLLHHKWPHHLCPFSKNSNVEQCQHCAAHAAETNVRVELCQELLLVYRIDVF